MHESTWSPNKYEVLDMQLHKVSITCIIVIHGCYVVLSDVLQNHQLTLIRCKIVVYFFSDSMVGVDIRWVQTIKAKRALQFIGCSAALTGLESMKVFCLRSWPVLFSDRMRSRAFLM